jgi:hypothetical protein
MSPEGFSAFVLRRRFVIFGVWLVHVFLIHYFVLGFVSWDGFGHRGVPVVELLQHGAMNKDHYLEWSLTGYLPSVELVHIPFLYLFGLKGFVIGFPLVVLPLATAAIYLLIRELTGDDRAATFGAFAYAAMPMINQQPFSGYIDFAVSGLLAFFLFALLRLRSHAGPRAYLVLALATAMFTMSRVQGLYVLLVVVPVVVCVAFVERERFRLRIPRPGVLGIALAAIAVGSIPAIAVQVWKYCTFGSPSFPAQFEMFGVRIGTGGLSLDEYFRLAGLGGHDWRSVLDGAWHGWIWHGSWPLGSFYASNHMALGLLAPLALVLFAIHARRLTRTERWLFGALLAVSLLSRDLAVPRWGYTIVVVLAVVLGRSLSALSTSPRARPAFWAVIAIVFIHLLRPEFDYLQYRSDEVTPRMDMAGSPIFFRRTRQVEPFPDLHGKFEIIETIANHFTLQIFGRALSNEVLGTMPGAAIGARCANLASVLEREPAALFIDDEDFTRDCRRACAFSWLRRCRAYRITPGP